MPVNINIDIDTICCVVTSWSIQHDQVVVEEQSAQETKPKRKHQTKIINKKSRKREDDLWIELWQICKLWRPNRDTYEYDILSQWVSVVSCVGVAISFHLCQWISNRRLQGLIV